MSQSQDVEMPPSEQPWVCPGCTLENEEDADLCAACELPKPSEEEEEEEGDGDEDLDGEEEDDEEYDEEYDEEDEEEDYDPGDIELGASLGDFYASDDDGKELLDDALGDDFDNVVGDALAKAGRDKVSFVIKEAEEAYNKRGKPKRVVMLDNDAGDGSEQDTNVVVRAAVDLKGLVDKLTARIWGVSVDEPIVLELSFQGPMYIEEAKMPPLFSVFQSSDKDLSQRVLQSRHSFGLEWQLRARLDDWLNMDDVWPASGTADRGKGFLTRAMAEVKQRVVDCTSTCMICDRQLPFAMVKPSICDNVLCIHSYEQYGLGADVATEIRENTEVVDLLISLCYSASQNDVKRFNPFPVGVQATIQAQDGSRRTTTEDFMKPGWQDATELQAAAPKPSKKAKRGKKSGKQEAEVPPAKDYSNYANAIKVKEVLDSMPPVAELRDSQDSSALKKVMDSRNPLLFPLLRWVITSNRAHLQRLEKKEQIPGMNTDLQYKFVSSPPEKEAEFQALKKQHGTVWAFHGSSFNNWHSILRVGLKNYSGTALMSTGAAYGSGIYLSPNASTSSGYSRPANGWPKSMLSESGSSYMQCICICELIDAGYKANPHYVIANEAHVMTRYFFIYSGSGGSQIPQVVASKLKNLKSSPLGAN